MIALFNEINQIESKNVPLNQCKQRILNQMTIKCDQICLSRNTIRNELIVLNQCCLHSLKGHHLDIQQKGFELFIKKKQRLWRFLSIMWNHWYFSSYFR